MTSKLPRSIFANPMVLMADLGLRALDMTVSSSLNICDGVDRLGRAAAADHARIQGTSWRFATRDGSARPAAAASPAAAAGSQRPALDLVMQGWLQWMSTMGTVASLGAGHRFGQCGQQGVARAIAPAAPIESARPAVPLPSRRGHREPSDADRTPREHARAAGESQRRRSTRVRSTGSR